MCVCVCVIFFTFLFVGVYLFSVHFCMMFGFFLLHGCMFLCMFFRAIVCLGVNVFVCVCGPTLESHSMWPSGLT